MSCAGQYGDHLTLIAATECFLHGIVVVTAEQGGVEYKVRPRGAATKGTVYLAHYPLARHYNRLVRGLLVSGGNEGSCRSLMESMASSVGMASTGVQRSHPLLASFAYLVTGPDGVLRRIRIEYDAFEGSVTIGYEELRTHLARIYGTESKGIILQWKDGDGDVITFDTDEELLNAVTSVAAAAKKVLRVSCVLEALEL